MICFYISVLDLHFKQEYLEIRNYITFELHAYFIIVFHRKWNKYILIKMF